MLLRGADVVSPANSDQPAGLLLATGSEVNLAIEAQKVLREQGIEVSVVSMPSWDRFEKQSKDYKDTILPPHVKKRLAIEMGASLGWHRYVGDDGDILSVDRFGASAPGERIIKEYGFTVENVVNRFKELLNNR